MYREALETLDAAVNNGCQPKATRAWHYVPDSRPALFCLELEPGKALTQGGEPIRMGFAQIKVMEERLNTGALWPPEKDIFRHLHKWAPASTIQILAPGPAGKGHWQELSRDHVTIVVNKAVDIPDVRKDIWLTSEGTAHLTKWFHYGLEHHYDIACMSNSDLAVFYPDGPYTHELGGMMTSGDVRPTPLMLRGGATITSMAVHLAYWLGAREIVLCGVDMKENVYYDYDPNIRLEQTEVGVAEYKSGLIPDFGKYVPLMQELCDWLIAHGVSVVTLSPTALTVETVTVSPVQKGSRVTLGRFEGEVIP